MPELPEVEITRQGIAPHLLNQTIENIIVRQPNLRWPVPIDSLSQLVGQPIINISRRAKFLLLQTHSGTLLIHLGMSGSLRILPTSTPPQKHDHADILLNNGLCLRYRDPRRFGAILWSGDAIENHRLLAHLGPEPLTRTFHSRYLYQALQNKSQSLKQCLMDNKIVVGVGNIYANEALFLAKLSPFIEGRAIQLEDCEALTKAIKQTLKKAIRAGGTSLKDFTQADGSPGYFRHQLQMYGRENEPCLRCQTIIKKVAQANRATYYCPSCQKP